MSLQRRVKREQERELAKMNDNPNIPAGMAPMDAKTQAAFEKAMQEEHHMVFNKAELIVIFNVMTNVSAKYGDFLAIDPIIKKIQPIVAVDSNIPAEPALIGGTQN